MLDAGALQLKETLPSPDADAVKFCTTLKYGTADGFVVVVEVGGIVEVVGGTVVVVGGTVVVVGGTVVGGFVMGGFVVDGEVSNAAFLTAMF